MQVAIITNTPEPMIWKHYTLGMIVRRLQRLDAVMPLFGLSPRDNDDAIDVDRSPKVAMMALRAMGLG